MEVKPKLRMQTGLPDRLLIYSFTSLPAREGVCPKDWGDERNTIATPHVPRRNRGPSIFYHRLQMTELSSREKSQGH